MQLVDEQDRVLGAFDFVHHRLDALFKLTAILGPGNHHREVKHHDPLVAQQLGDFPTDDHLSEAFDDRGLAHARFTEQHGIVLLTATENLDHTFNLVRATDHRIEFVLASQFGEIAAEAVEGRCLALARLAAATTTSAPTTAAAAFLSPRAAAPFATVHTVAEQVQHFFSYVFEFQPEVHQDLRGHTFLLTDQPQEQVFGADVVVVEVPRLFHRVLDHLLGARRLWQLAHRDHVRSRLHDLLDL